MKKHDLDIKKTEQREQAEKEVLEYISVLDWDKTQGASNVVYTALFYDEKKVELEVNITVHNKKIQKKYTLKYGNKEVLASKYNGEEIVREIECTQPITKKRDKVKSSAKRKTVTKGDVSKNSSAVSLKKQKNAKKTGTQTKKRLQKEKIQRAQEEKRIREAEETERLHARYQEEIRKLPQIDIKDFLVRGNVFKCMHSAHKVVDLTAVVKVINHDGSEQLVKIAAGYCAECNVYFIMESTYQMLKSMGVVLCRICDEKSYMKNIWVNGMQLAQESVLMQFGYTVSQEEGLYSHQRHRILAAMIDYKVLSKSEIISYLDFFISQRHGQRKYEMAISKWEMDRDFVRDYRSGEFAQIGVKTIHRK